MKITLHHLLAFCLFVSCNLRSLSQVYYPNYDFSDSPNGFSACPYDSSQFWDIPEWDMFCTTDSSRWGPRDSSCFNEGDAFGPNVNAEIWLNSLPVGLPLVVVSELDSSNAVPLQENKLYKIAFYYESIFGMDPSFFLFGNGCPDGICTGMKIGIEVPDSAGTGSLIRWYEATNDPGMNRFVACIPTEYFVGGNRIRHTWVKFQREAQNVLSQIELRGILIEDMFYNTELLDSLPATFNGTNWEYYMHQYSNPNSCLVGECYNHVLRFDPNVGYPSINNQSYVEVYPTPNTASSQVIDVYVPWDNVLLSQPFTSLRGGMPLADTNRHVINLINNGGVICSNMFIEIMPFTKGNTYTHKAGNVELNGPMACFLVADGGKIIVADGVRFDYGMTKSGMMALRTGGEIVIGRGAELVFHNNLVFGEHGHETLPQTIKIELKPQSKLTFLPGSKVQNWLSKFPESQLEIHMLGGVLDDSGLDAASRSRIKRVYPIPEYALRDNIKMGENPFGDKLELTLTEAANERFTLRLLDMRGILVKEVNGRTENGVNVISFSTSDLPSGFYLLQVETDKAIASYRVAKQ